MYWYVRSRDWQTRFWPRAECARGWKTPVLSLVPETFGGPRGDYTPSSTTTTAQRLPRICRGFSFPHQRRLLLGASVVQKRATPALNRSQVFQFRGAPLDRQKINMEVKISVRPFGGRLPHQHHQGHGKSVQIIVLLANHFEKRSQVLSLPIVQIAQALKMAPRINLHLRGKAAEIWQQCHERVVG